MSGDITFTFTGANTTANITFTGSSTQTCQYTINGTGGGTLSMNNFFVTLSAGTDALRIFNVTGPDTITGFTIDATIIDNLVSVASTSANWGLTSSTSNPKLNTLLNAFNGAINLTAVPADIPVTVQVLEGTFQGCTSFNQTINWSVQNVTDMKNMFYGATTFNNGGAALWTPSTTFTSVANVTNMEAMFRGCAVFNQDISGWNTGNVINMSNMFLGCIAFNKDITGWNTSSVITMAGMFNAAPNSVFNQNITYWTVRSDCALTNMFTDPSAFKTAYYGTSVYYSASSGTTNPTTTPNYQFFGQPRPTKFPCFMKGTQILCFRAEEEVYRPIQDLRKGDLVKTYRNGYLPIHMIGTSRLSNPGDEERISNRLYKCSKELYPDLFEDLYITGCHSILVPSLTNDQWENTKEMLGNVYITDNHFRLMACVDEKAQPFKRNAMIDIYHIALENDDYYMNYGVYANGLLVETCSKRYLKELSNMEELF